MSKEKLTQVGHHLERQEPDVVLHPAPPSPDMIPKGRQPIYRLSLRPSAPLPYTPALLHQQVLNSPKDTVFFVDANVFFNDVYAEAWNALLVRKVAITPLVFHEIKRSWVANPSANRHIHQHVLDWIEKKESSIFELFYLDPSDPVVAYCVPYYIRLLVARKQLWGIVETQLSRATARPQTDIDVERYIKKHFGERGYQRAKKGKETEGSPTFAADEEMVVYAFMHALSFGTETVILSGDPDIEDQVYKMQWLLDTHYRSMLFAERWAKGEIHLPAKVLDVSGAALSEAFQGDDALLVEGRSAHLMDVLPEHYTPTLLYNWLVTGPSNNMRLYPMTWCLETEMREVLRVKADTNGRNTVKLDGRNCHVWQRPLPIPDGCVAIARDRRFRLGDIDLPILDLQHALMTDERINHLYLERGWDSDQSSTP
jgi:cytochrome b